MCAQSRLLAIRKLSFRESWLLNQPGGTAAVKQTGNFGKQSTTWLDFTHFNRSCDEGVNPNLLPCGIRSVSGGCGAWAAVGGGAGAAGGAGVGYGDIGSNVGVWRGVSLLGTTRGPTSASGRKKKACEYLLVHACHVSHGPAHLQSDPPLSRIVLNSDLKDAYKSGMFSSSKEKRSGGSADGFDGAAAVVDEDE